MGELQIPKITTFASVKGGVAKTTATACLAAALSRTYPGQVLLVDLDPNNNLTDMAIRDSIDDTTLSEGNVLHILTGKKSIQSVIYPSSLSEGLSIIPATPMLARVGVELFGQPGVLLKFPKALRSLRQFRFIIIDSPPALTLELRAALYAADNVIVPVNISRWSLQAFILIQQEIADVVESIGKGPQIHMLPAMVTDAQSLKLREIIKGFPFVKTSIPRNNALLNSGSAAVLPKLGSVGAEAFAALAEEVALWE